MLEKKWRLKVICLTPKGKSEKASQSFGMKYFNLINKPIAIEIVNDHEFYYIYEFKREKDMDIMIHKKIPGAVQKIRGFYLLVIHLVDKGNKLGKKGAWTVERIRRWMIKRFRKEVKNAREMDDFLDAIEMDDRDEIMELISKNMISYEVLEDEPDTDDIL